MTAAILAAALALGSYSAIRGNGEPFIRRDGSIDSVMCAKQARYPVSILDAHALVRFPQIGRTIRHYNPSQRIIAYVLLGYWRNPCPQPCDTTTQSDLPWKLWECIRDSENRGERAVLWNINGTSRGINIASQSTVRAFADTILKYVVNAKADASLYRTGERAQPVGAEGSEANASGGSASRQTAFDGLFLDCACPEVTNSSASGIDVRRAGYATDREFEDAWRSGSYALWYRLRQGVMENGPVEHAASDVGGVRDFWNPVQRETSTLTAHDFYLTGNCGPDGKWHGLLNGWMRENFPWQGAGPRDDPWRAAMLGNQYGAPGYFSQDTLMRSPTLNWITVVPSGWEPETRRRMRFALGSALLTDHAISSLGRLEWTIGKGDSAWRWLWLDEYEIAQRLGAALEPAREDSITGLWTRRYERGITIPNPTPRWRSWYSREVDPATGKGVLYRDARGVWRRAWSVAPYNAVILQRAR